MKRKTDAQIRGLERLDSWVKLSNRELKIWLASRPRGSMADDLANAFDLPMHVARYRLKYLQDTGGAIDSDGLWFRVSNAE